MTAKQTPNYGDALNSHHLLLCVALAFMTLSHLAAFLVPDDQLWYRAVGRVAAPTFLFLVGHNSGRRIGTTLILWASVLALVEPLIGDSFFPLNILFTIALCRLALRDNDRYHFIERFPVITVGVCVILMPLSLLLFEYGTLGLLFAFFGHMVQQKKMNTYTGWLIAVSAYTFYIIEVLEWFPFTLTQSAVMIALQTVALVGLSRFRFVKLTFASLPWLKAPLVWLARHSLQYYVTHLVLLMAISRWFGLLPYTPRWFY